MVEHVACVLREAVRVDHERSPVFSIARFAFPMDYLPPNHSRHIVQQKHRTT